MTAIISNLEVVELKINLEIKLHNRVADTLNGEDNPDLIAHAIIEDETSAHNNTDLPTPHALKPSDFDVDWLNKLNDSELDKLAIDGWLVIDDVFDHRALQSLQAESGFIEYRDAELTAGIRLSHIRGDKIRWINEHFFAGFYYLQSINALAAIFNQTLFTGIRHSEAHYACYPIGFGYQWHSDNPTGRDERVLSAVFYLNDNWEASAGGAVEIVDNHGVHHTVMPVANRLIVFNSDLQHQVQIAHRQRYSIATWMRRDGLVPFVE